MEILRYKYIFVITALVVSTASKEFNRSEHHKETCPLNKIIEDIFKVNKNNGSSQMSERAKLFLHSIANITSKKDDISQDKLVDDIIAAINRIKVDVSKESNADIKLNEAIILTPGNQAFKNHFKAQIIKSGMDEKNDRIGQNSAKQTNSQVEARNATTERTSYVEIRTIEPNSTHKNTASSNNILDILKNLMANTTTNKELHNIKIIEKNINRNHSFSTTKNVSTIIVTYCDKENNTKANLTLSDEKSSTLDDNYDYYADGDDESDDYDSELNEGDKREILEAAEYGMQKMHELYSVVEPKLYSMGFWLDNNNPARYVAAFNAPSEDSARFTRYGYASLQAATKLKELISGSSEGIEGRTGEAQFPTANALRQSSLLQHCPLKGAPKCPPASKRYRTHDGTCNNLNRPRWGSTMTPVQRFLRPSYSDGLQAPRRSIFGTTLPSAREISALVHESRNVESPGITHLLMQWGQFLDHDVTSSSQSRGFNGSVPRCCKDGGKDFVSKEFMHPECLPIAVPPSDPFYGPRGVRCLDFVRSSPAPRDDCALGWREQLNQVSAYIDGSPIYASSARQSDKLRLFRNGMLQYGRVQQRRPILPPPERRDEMCRGGAVSTDCFKSGDGRVNEHPGLVAAHIVWLRHHNRMAQELAHLNPHWSDEKIYQETRKVIGAMVQHITYREFLPVVLGSDVMEIFDLDPQKKGYYKGYSPKINASPASSFGAAAFRFGHSLVQPTMVRYDRFHRPIHNNVSLHMELTNPSNIWSLGAVDRLLLGMANQPIQRRDEFITEELTNHLFQTTSTGFGMDLAAINIQRGRDHGVPPYTSWREPCGLSAISGFEDLFKVMPARAVRKLKVLYRHVDDVDLFTGGMAERPVVGGLVGPTFACIIAQQFSNLRKGDRFWYENGGFESSFTPAQLQQIRRISFAQVLCRTLDAIDDIQPFAFLSPDHPDNDRISCQNGLLNNFDLSPWVEIDSESDNDIRKSDRTTQRPQRKTTLKTNNTTAKIHHKISSSNDKKTHQDNAKTMNVTDQPTDDNVAAKDGNDTLNFTFNIDEDATTVKKTVQIDDKLDFKNKSKRFDDTDSRSKPSKQYSDYDYEDDDDTQSVQSVVINQSPHKRPYHYQSQHSRPVLTVTENINKYTYLINYVPRPTESYRRTTKKPYDRNRDRDIVKVTYQTYDDTYRRPNKPYYYTRPDYNDNYRNNRPNTRTTEQDNYHSSARSNDKIERTTAHLTQKTKSDLTDKPDSTTENLYRLVTFGYVGSYKGDMNDKLNIKTDDRLTQKTHKDENKHEIISKDFSTLNVTPEDNKGKTDTVKLSTFYMFDSSTKPYNLQRSTRRNDQDVPLMNNNRPVSQTPVTTVKDKVKLADQHIVTKPDATTKKVPNHEYIIKENYNSPGSPETGAEERLSLDNMPELDDAVSKSANQLKGTVKKPSKPAKTPSVAFQVIPSEISPSHWAVYDEGADLPEQLPHRSPSIKTDPHALKEIPRPMTLLGLRRRRPGLF